MLAVLRAITIGVVLGIDAIGHNIALAVLIFSGPMVLALGLGSALFLLSTAVMALVLARFSQFRTALGITQDTSVAILAPAIIAAATAATGPQGAAVATGIAVIALSTVLTGAVLSVAGWANFGRFARLLPYSVSAGFLASSGWLLTYTAILVATDARTLSGAVAAVKNGASLVNLLAASGLALALLTALRLFGGATTVVIVLIAAVVAFYLGLGYLGIDAETARGMALLPTVQTSDLAFPALTSLPGLVDWQAVAAQTPVLAIVVIVNIIGFTLNVTGTELALREDVRVDREMRVTGLGNLVIGAFGGMTSFMTIGSTVMAAETGVTHRAFPVTVGIMTLIACLFAAPIVRVVPNFVSAGLLLFIGLSMLQSWLWDTRKVLTRTDWLTVLSIVLITVGFGIMPAVLTGLILALLLFVVNYARVPVIRRSTTGVNRRSTVDRAAHLQPTLAAQGASLRVLELQGYLFFGSIDSLLKTLRETAASNPQFGHLVLDFNAVTGIDSSACAGLLKLGIVARRLGVSVTLTHVSQGLFAELVDWQMISPDMMQADGPHIRWIDTTDDALERHENAVLEAAAPDGPGPGALYLTLGGGAQGEAVSAYADRLSLAPGEVIIRDGESRDDIYVVLSGRLGVWINDTAGRRIRIRSMAAGAVVGEIAHYLGTARNAEVMATEPSEVLRFSAGAIANIERDAPDLAIAFHRFLAGALADKVQRTNRLLLDR